MAITRSGKRADRLRVIAADSFWKHPLPVKVRLVGRTGLGGPGSGARLAIPCPEREPRGREAPKINPRPRAFQAGRTLVCAAYGRPFSKTHLHLHTVWPDNAAVFLSFRSLKLLRADIAQR